ncbi:MAG: Hsp33 family molecular chaperone HslO [Eubacteriaceae bacterium]
MDYIISATVKNEPIRIMAIDSTKLVTESCKIHGTSHTASAALGRVMSTVAMLTSLLKNKKDKISVQIKCDGPIKNIIVVGNEKGEIKADIYNSEVSIPLNNKGKLDVSAAIGKGILTVIRDMGLKKPYIGTVEIVSGEIAQDFTYYFAVSEQIPSVVSLGVLVNPDGSIKKAGGYIIQLLPNHSEELVEYIENKIKNIPSMTSMLNDGNTPEDIIKKIFNEYKVDFTSEKVVEYYCDCNRNRFERGLISLGKQEIEDILYKDEKAEVKCHFCKKEYLFKREDLEKMIEKMS